MDIYTIILSFVFGTVIGSFLNVVALRFNTGVGVGGRSMCMTCGKTLTWMELVPILSFIYQRGLCGKCKSKISWQYPLIEFMAGVIFAMIIVVYPPVTPLQGLTTIIYLLTACLLLVIAIYDTKHKIIPDSFVYTFIAISFLGLFVGGSSWFHIPYLCSLAAGPLLALPFALLSLISKETWMGWGDSKLVLGIGWILGLAGGLNAIILAFWIAAAVSIIWLFSTYKTFKPKTQVPFGPYLILGMYLVLLFGLQVIDLSVFGL